VKLSGRPAQGADYLLIIASRFATMFRT
jgi:hypothetical protein